MEVAGCEVVDDGPGRQHRQDADRGTGHPAALVVVPLDPEDRHPVEEGEDEEEAGVDVEEEEGLSGHVTLGVEARAVEGDGEGHVDDVPLGGDDDLDHHHEEERQELIDLEKYLINKD